MSFDFSHSQDMTEILSLAKKQHPMVEHLIDHITALFPKIMAAIEERKVSVTNGYLTILQSVEQKRNIITTRISGALSGTFLRPRNHQDNNIVTVSPISIRPATAQDTESWFLTAELVTTSSKYSSYVPLLSYLLGVRSTSSTQPPPVVCVQAKLVEVVTSQGEKSYRYTCNDVIKEHPMLSMTRILFDDKLVPWLTLPSTPPPTPTSSEQSSSPIHSIKTSSNKGYSNTSSKNHTYAPEYTHLPFHTWNSKRSELGWFKCSVVWAMAVIPLICVCLMIMDISPAAVMTAVTALAPSSYATVFTGSSMMMMMTPLPSKPSPARRPTNHHENNAFRVREMKKNEGKEFNASWGNVHANKGYVSGAGTVF